MRNVYSAIFTIGILVGFLWLAWFEPSRRRSTKAPPRSDPRLGQIDAALIAVFLGLLGARVGFVALHWEYYASNPVEMLWLWQGGLSWAGGASAAILGIGLYALLSDQSFWALADSLAFPAGFIALSAWSGCYLDGCAYGIRMPQSAWTPAIGDMFGSYTSRWPTQLVGIIASALTLLSLYLLSSLQLKDGVLGSLSLTMITAAALALSFTRADPALLLHGLRLDTLSAALVLLAALSMLVYCISKKDNQQKMETTQ